MAPAAAPLFSRGLRYFSSSEKTKALVKRGRKELQPRSRCALLSATGFKVAHACARWYVSSGIAAPVCLGRHFCRIPVLCPWADSRTRSTDRGENSWSQYTNKGGWLSAADLDVASPKPSVDLFPFCAEPASAPRRGWGYGTVFTEQAEPCFPDCSEHAEFRRRKKICLSQPREDTPHENGQPPAVCACSVPGFPVLFLEHP